MPIYVSCSDFHDIGKNINILQHLQSDSRSGASTKLFANLLIQLYLNNGTNLHQLTLHSSLEHHALQHGDRIVTIDIAYTRKCTITRIHK